MESIDGYYAEISKIMQMLPVAEINTMVRLLHDARLNNQQVFVMGNGGSASTATHFVCDLIKNTRAPWCPDFRVIGLADNMATFSAYSNDEGYNKVFSMQLASLANRGDIVIAISTSGKSPNVLEAVETARKKGAITIGLTGKDGGKLGEIVHLNVHIANWRPDQTEDVHLIVLHSITAILREMAKPIKVVEHILPEVSHSIPAVEGGSGQLSPTELMLQPQPALDPMLALIDQIERDPRTLFDCPELLSAVLLQLTKSLGAASGSFVLLNEEASIVTAALVYGGRVNQANLEQMNEFMRGGLAGWAVKNHQPALLTSTQKDHRWMEGVQQTSFSREARSVLCVPLMNEERVAGVITLSRPSSNPFSGKELIILTGFIAAVTSRVPR